MSNECVNNNTSTGGNIATYALMPSIVLGGSAAKATISARGVKNAIKLQNREGFKHLANSLDCDVFTKSVKLAGEYEKHKTLVSSFNKWNNKLKKLAKASGVSEEIIKNSSAEELIKIVKNTNLDDNAKSIVSSAQEATSALRKMDEAINSGKTTINAVKNVGKEAAEEIAENGSKGFFGRIFKGRNAKNAANAAKAGGEIVEQVAKSGFGGTVKSLFKTEIKSKFNIALTALTFIPNVINKVIPAFKEQGFAAGMKETGKVLIQGTTDLFSYALGGSIGRTIGGVIGSIFPGFGTVIGATIGDMVGSMFVGGKITKAVENSLNKNETAENDETQLQTADMNQKFGMNVASKNQTYNPSFNANPLNQQQMQINRNLRAVQQQQRINFNA